MIGLQSHSNFPQMSGAASYLSGAFLAVFNSLNSEEELAAKFHECFKSFESVSEFTFAPMIMALERYQHSNSASENARLIASTLRKDEELIAQALNHSEVLCQKFQVGQEALEILKAAGL